MTTTMTSSYLWRTRCSDLSPLGNLARLERLGLSDCEHLCDLAPLAGLSRLKELAIDGTRVESLSPLSSYLPTPRAA
jgi:Leucine-rich repeat (LRR) protein